jgi:hypothetical protein
LLRQNGLRVLNLGLGAGMGARVLGRYALAHARPGDLVIASIEPDLLTGDMRLEPLGLQFGFAIGDRALGMGTGLGAWGDAWVGLRPGGYHWITLFWKILLRQPMYRYGDDEFRTGGWHAVEARRPVAGPPVMAPKLSARGREWLLELRQICDGRGIRLCYMVPWGYCPGQTLWEYRRGLAVFAAEIAKVVPVIKDAGFGADAERERFADTPWHPTPAAVEERVPDLAGRLASAKFWDTDELEELVRSMSTVRPRR